MSLFNELNRRKVFRVAIGYVVAAWLIAQVADLLADTYLAPAWVMQMIVTLLIVGLPISLALSWTFDLTGEGVRRTVSGGVEGSLTVSNKSLLGLVCGLFIAVTLSFYVFWPRGDRSVAVLPFEDISPGGDQAYFGNGIADELRLELQRLDGLRVAGRTSTIVFAQNDSKTIGENLNVDSILEGSIRKDGDQVRITAQLINIADEEIMWAQDYDRELTDIFVIQEEIATEVSGALGVRLGVGGVNAFRGAGTRNVEAYELYLRSPLNASDESISNLTRATQLDPNYAAAWTRLGLNILGTGWDKYPGENYENQELAYKYVELAVMLDPESAQSNARFGQLLSGPRRDWIQGEEYILKSISLSFGRGKGNSYATYGGQLTRAGRTAAALEMYEKAEAARPLVEHYYFRVYIALAQGRFAHARDVLALSGPRGSLKGADLTIALHEGDVEEIKSLMAAKPPADISTSELYAPVLKVFDSPEKVLPILRTAYADNDTRWPSKLHDIALLAAYLGDPELALQAIGEEARKGSPRLYALWFPLMSDVRKLDGFKQLVTDLNLVEYWRASGWTDHCRPLGDDDFECF